MAQESSIRAVLFVKDLKSLANFYAKGLGFMLIEQDRHHAVLKLCGFELVVHQIPEHIAAAIEITNPPARREGGTLRLDIPVASIESSRSSAASLGGTIDVEPPSWAEPGTKFFLGNDPEGNVFGVSQQEP